MEETDGKGKRRGPHRPLEQRIQLYNEVHRLRQQGLSQSGITETIRRYSGVRLSSSIVSCWVRGIQRPLGNVNEFNATPSPALAYIIGVKASDGCVYCNTKRHVYTFELMVSDYEFAAETGQNLVKLLGQKESFEPRWDRSNHCWRIWCCSILLCQLLQQPLEQLRTYIEHCTDCTAAFLRGFFDGEASIQKRELMVHNTNNELLSYIWELLERHFAIEATGPHMSKRQGYRFRSPKNGKVYRTRKACYLLYIRVRSLPLFHRYIGFSIRRKQQILIGSIQ